MLFYKFKNYEEFKELFGIQEHASGEKSRKNKILLAFIKDRERLHEAVQTRDFFLLHITDMRVLKKAIWDEMEKRNTGGEYMPYRVELINRVLNSSKYETDECRGVCSDGDIRSVRYINHNNNDRIYKMKAGKFLRNLIQENDFGKTLPEAVVTFLMEEFTQEWQVYSQRTLPENTLYVDDDFHRIYNSAYYASGDFHSCMTDKDLESFYSNAVEAQAAYLENEEGEIVARCVIFIDVHEEGSDKIWRLAERQYAVDGSDIIKRALIDALIREGYIDGYKVVGAGCGESRAFVDIHGNSLADKKFSISCNLATDEDLTYQDSFKYYNYAKGVAYNHTCNSYDYELDTTDGRLESDEDYDEYHDYYCQETRLVFQDGRELYCDVENLSDFRYIDRRNEYHHIDDCVKCEDTEDWEVRDDAWYSDITEEYYSTRSAMLEAEEEYKESNWFFSEFDQQYYENILEVVSYMKWDKQRRCYIEETIYIGTLINLIRNEVFHVYEGEVYNMLCHGKPMLLAA